MIDADTGDAEPRPRNAHAAVQRLEVSPVHRVLGEFQQVHPDPPTVVVASIGERALVHLGDARQRIRRRFPDTPVPTATAVVEEQLAVHLGDRQRLDQRAPRPVVAVRDVCHSPVAGELPAVERALEAIAAHAPECEVGAKMRTECGRHMRLTVFATPCDEVPTETFEIAHLAGAQRRRAGDAVPAIRIRMRIGLTTHGVRGHLPLPAGPAPES